MEDRKTKLRRWAIRAEVVFVFLLLDATVGYYLWTRLSVLMAMRVAVQRAGLPLEVKEARWNATWKDLQAGRVDELDVLFVLKPTDLWVRVRTPIRITKINDQWKLSLEPLVEVRGFPVVRGRVEGEATVLSQLQRGKKIDPRGGSLRVFFEPKEGLAYKDASFEAKIRKFSLLASLRWDPSQPEESKQLFFETTLTAKDFSGLYDDLIVDEPSIIVKASGYYNGKRLRSGKLALVEPLEVDATLEANQEASVKNAHGAVRFEWKTKDVFDERIARWLENRLSFLRRSKSKGSIGVRANWLWSEKSGFKAHGDLQVRLKKLDIPKKDFLVSDLETRYSIQWPLPQKESSPWNELRFEEVDLSTAKLKPLEASYRVFSVGDMPEVEFKADQPIRQEVFGGMVQIKNVHGSYSPERGPTIQAALEAGPFQIPRIQKDLCVVPNNPINGQVRATYPEINISDGNVELKGRADANLFGGTVHTGSIFIENGGMSPLIKFWVEGKDLDLQSLGAWTRIGDMRGSLNWHLYDTIFTMSPYGPVPLEYHLLLKGKERGGTQIRFYGRAIYNILELMGSREQDFPVYAQWTLKLSTMYRNLFPAVAEYMGFEAISKEGYTTLRTFDPPASKNHYFLFGNAFKIPLNTKGIFPVRMQADAFQGWLYGMLEYFKKKQAEKSKDNKESNDATDCKPIF